MGLEPQLRSSTNPVRLPGFLTVPDRDHKQSIPVAVTTCDQARVTTNKWGGRWDSNPRRPGSQPGALPTELRPPRLHHNFPCLTQQSGAPGRTRTCNPGLEGRCSIRLSYGRSYVRPAETSEPGRGREIRTPDPLLPKQMRYQTAPCPDARFSARTSPGRGRILRGHDDTGAGKAKQGFMPQLL